MISDVLNLHVYPIRTQMNGTQKIPTSRVYYKDEIELKQFLANKTLSQIYSTDKDESKGIIVDKFSTEEDES